MVWIPALYHQLPHLKTCWAGEGRAKDVWMHKAIEEASRIENEQYQKCQSKGGYVNLCAHAMRALCAETEEAKCGD